MGKRRNVLKTVQQISFAKLLAGNDKGSRDRGLKKLRNYFIGRSEGVNLFSEDDFMRIWKGLYYCMWMSDKPLIQEELAENISSLVHCFQNIKSAVLFMQTFFLTMETEWFGIDQYRLDKFLMLVRRFLRQVLVYCRQKDWDVDLVEQITTMFSSTVLSVSSGKPTYLGLVLHFIDIFPEELAKVGKDELPQDIVLQFLRPFLLHMSEQDEERTRSHVLRHIFHHLIKQSDMGIEYEEKFAAWKRAGFPGESCDDMERVELEDSSSGEDDLAEAWDSDIKDPRAGKVDVTLPQLQFDPEKIAEIVLDYAKKASVLKSRKVLNQLAEQFSHMAKGKYPLGFNVKVPEGILNKKKKSKKGEVLEAAKELMLFEESLKNKTNKDKGHKRKYKEDDQEIDEVIVDEENDKTVSKQSEWMELKLTRCDAPNLNVKKRRKRKSFNVLAEMPNGNNSDDTDILNINKTSDSLSSEIDELSCMQGTKDSSEQLTFSRKKTLKSAKRELRVILKDINSYQKQGRSTPLKRRQSSISKWEVTPISETPSKDSEQIQQMQPLEEKTKSVKDVPSSTSSFSPSQQAAVNTSTKTSFTPLSSPSQQAAVNTPTKTSLPSGTLGSAKKVNIALSMNKEQKMSDYVKALKNSPSIPFDADKKPVQGVLKPSPFGSPINPFFRRSGRKISMI